MNKAELILALKKEKMFNVGSDQLGGYKEPIISEFKYELDRGRSI